MSDPSAHPAHGATFYRDPDAPFSDRPVDISIEEFYVFNVPGVDPQTPQRRIVVKIARFGPDDDPQSEAATIARLLTGDDRTG